MLSETLANSKEQNLPWENIRLNLKDDFILEQTYDLSKIELLLKTDIFKIYNNWDEQSDLEKKESIELMWLWGEYVELILVKRASFMKDIDLDKEYQKLKDRTGKRTNLRFANLCSCHGALGANISIESNKSALEHARYFATRMIKGYNLRKEMMETFNSLSISYGFNFQ